jgi:LacI family transcriptional regulator
MVEPDARPAKPASKPTIYDVADAAGVAISTVSRVLNNSRDVSEATRETVLEAIEELQFRPNRTARSLAQRTARTLAVAVPTFTTPFHNELLKGVRSQLGEADVDLLLCDLAWAAPKSTLKHFLERGAMDGLLLAGLDVDDAIGRELQTLGAPVVLIGCKWDAMDSFYWAEQAGVELAVAHLAEQGHARIAMIAPHIEGAIRDARIAGFRAALEGCGVPFHDELVAYGETRKHAGFSEESGYEAMQRLLALGEPPTAVFASSDVQAIGAWQAIRHAGQRVPADFALVGYDDIKVSRFIGLSSVAQNMHDVGEEAADLLLRRIAGERGTPVSKQVVPELIVRKSSVQE